MNRLIIVVLLFLGAFVRAESWQADPSTLAGQLELLQAVLQRHPGMVTANLRFRRNLVDALRPAAELKQLLGENAASWEIGPSTRHAVQFTPGGEFRYDEAKLAVVKKTLTDDLAGVELTELKGLAEDLQSLKVTDEQIKPARRETIFRERVKALVRLAPFLYDGEGRPRAAKMDAAGREAVRKTIAGETPGGLQNRYLDQLKAHNADQIKAASEARGFRQIGDLYKSVTDNFVAHELKPATTARYTSVNGLPPRTLSIEAMPPVVALLRGCFGGDCSMLSVPNFPLVKGAKAYWIRTEAGEHAPTEGYVFVAPIVIDGKTYPKIITVNGERLQENEVRVIAKLVAHDWKTTHVVVPNFSRNPYVVNTDGVRKGLSFSRARAVSGQMAPGWDVVDAYTAKHQIGTYRNYYHSDNMKDAYMVAADDAQFPRLPEIATTQTVSYPKTSPDKVTPLARALLAAQIFADSTSWSDRRKIREQLGVTTHQVGAATPLRDLTPERPLTAKEFKNAAKELGLTADDIANYEPRTRAATLGAIHKGDPKTFDAETWKRLVDGTHARLDALVGITIDDAPELAKVLTAKFALPEELSRAQMKEMAGWLHGNKADAFKLAIAKQLATLRCQSTDLRDGLAELAEKTGSAEIRKLAIDAILKDQIRDGARRRALVTALPFGHETFVNIHRHLTKEDYADPAIQKALITGLPKSWQANVGFIVGQLIEHPIADPDHLKNLAKLLVDKGTRDVLTPYFAGTRKKPAPPPLEARRAVLTEALRTLDSYGRSDLYETLVTLAPNHTETHDVLMLGLSDPNGQVRNSALSHLHKLKVAGAEAEKLYLKLMKDDFWTVRYLAAQRIGQLDQLPPGAREALAEASRDPISDSVRIAAIQALAKHGDDASWVEAMQGLGEKDTTPEVTRKLIKGLEPARRKRLLLAAFRKFDSTNRYWIGRRLADEGKPDAATIEAFLWGLDNSKDDLNRKMLVEKLAPLAADATVQKRLAGALADASHEVRTEAVKALGATALHDPATLVAIAKNLTTCEDAVKALLKGNPAHRPRAASIDAALAALSGADTNLQRALWYYLNDHAPKDLRVQHAVAEGLKHADAQQRQHAIHLLSTMKPTDPEVHAKISAALRDADSYVARAAAEALGKVKPGGGEYPAALAPLLKHADAAVRLEGIKTLAKLAPHDREVYLEIVRALGDRDDVASNAQRVLDDPRLDRALLAELIFQALETPTSELRRRALPQLAKYAAGDPRFGALIADALADADGNTKAEALKLALKHKPAEPRIRDAIANLVGHDWPSISSNALTAFYEMTGWEARHYTQLAYQLDAHDERAGPVKKFFNRLGGRGGILGMWSSPPPPYRETALAGLLASLDGKPEHGRLQKVETILEHLAPDDARARDIYLRIVRDRAQHSEAVVSQALYAIARMPGEIVEGREHIVAAAREKDVWRRWATPAIARFPADAAVMTELGRSSASTNEDGHKSLRALAHNLRNADSHRDIASLVGVVQARATGNRKTRRLADAVLDALTADERREVLFETLKSASPEVVRYALPELSRRAPGDPRLPDLLATALGKSASSDVAVEIVLRLGISTEPIRNALVQGVINWNSDYADPAFAALIKLPGATAENFTTLALTPNERVVRHLRGALHRPWFAPARKEPWHALAVEGIIRALPHVDEYGIESLGALLTRLAPDDPRGETALAEIARNNPNQNQRATKAVAALNALKVKDPGTLDALKPLLTRDGWVSFALPTLRRHPPSPEFVEYLAHLIAAGNTSAVPLLDEILLAHPELRTPEALARASARGQRRIQRCTKGYGSISS